MTSHDDTETQSTATSTTESADLDFVLETLASERTRTVYRTLRSMDDPSPSMGALLDALLARKPSALPAERDRLTVVLTHAVLPRLAAADLVEYDEADGRVAPREPDRWSALLSALEEVE